MKIWSGGGGGGVCMCRGVGQRVRLIIEGGRRGESESEEAKREKA